MPVVYSIDCDTRIISTVCSGPLRLSDVTGHFRALMDDPACTGRLDVLLDVSDVSTLPESSQLGLVKSEVAAVRKKVEWGLCAIAANSDAMFGMMRMFEVIVGPYFHEIRVFRSKTDAEGWLSARRSVDPPPPINL